MSHVSIFYDFMKHALLDLTCYIHNSLTRNKEKRKEKKFVFVYHKGFSTFNSNGGKYGKIVKMLLNTRGIKK